MPPQTSPFNGFTKEHPQEVLIFQKGAFLKNRSNRTSDLLNMWNQETIYDLVSIPATERSRKLNLKPLMRGQNNQKSQQKITALEALKRPEVNYVDLCEKLIPGGCAKSSDFGVVTSCPTNIGTGMRASVHIKLPKLTSEDVFTHT